MTANKFIQRFLRLKGLFVYSFHFRIRDKTLDLYVKPYKNGRLCPVCNRRCKIVWVLKERSWRDIVVCKWTVYFRYSPREIICPTHGRKQEIIPWADAHSRITYRIEYLMLVYCQIMTQKAAAMLLGFSTSTLSNHLHRSITRIRDGHRIRGLRSIGIDEISYKKGKKYATLVYDLERSRVVWVGKGKGRETIDIFFNEILSEHQKKAIKSASCDMSAAYIGAIEHHCTNAVLVLDRFHIVKALNKAVDDVRKEQWREASDCNRKMLKGLRWLLYKHSSNRSKSDSRILNALQKGNRRIHRAWVLKDEFEQFWDYQYPKSAKRFLEGWMTTALKSRLEPIREFVKTLRKHSHRIITFIGTRLTNAIAEGLNRIVKIVKNRASGFRTLEAFTDLIYLTVGDVDIPAQISSDFRTI